MAHSKPVPYQPYGVILSPTKELQGTFIKLSLLLLMSSNVRNIMKLLLQLSSSLWCWPFISWTNLSVFFFKIVLMPTRIWGNLDSLHFWRINLSQGLLILWNGVLGRYSQYLLRSKWKKNAASTPQKKTQNIALHCRTLWEVLWILSPMRLWQNFLTSSYNILFVYRCLISSLILTI
jgi:hypothetical protein